ncbi:FAD-binding oxidoreductase [Jannaschia seohaensis]|uniref:FAD/FMN-containing dehydrogenase n=1 Tax=Jannaschia seohaensis TaxID=475081 RepID=A0A2Y9A2D9_9RHOB|nr:FAD-binding oxidoreductase [Jannaschia seohaensis]PWJ22306.1 FAD/FMN-containing dehydrogenase [Jannaschia seohaensis]SSA38584.1 FAD/FMN-containing dehydrogenase [Jannaschia seohaensis]
MTLSPATDAFAEGLHAVLPNAAFREMEPRFLEEPRGRWRGTGGLLLAPGSTGEVAAIVQACAAACVPILPYGGGTGLVGGQVSDALDAPVILSLDRMNRVRSVDPAENAMTVEAGVILQTVQEAAEAVDRLFPLSIASQGSARIGGILATNAGGVNVLRYGNARDLCLGLEAVMPDGSVLHGLSPLRKNNTGYDLRHLLIGAEGTLGIITAATLKLLPRPARTGAAMMVLRDAAAALELLNLARDRIGEGVSAFELIGGMGLTFLAETMPEVRLPIGQPDWSVLIDLGLGDDGDPEEALMGLFEAAAEAELVTDGVIAQSEAQRADFWTVRESIPAANRRIGAIASHDISLPLSALPRFIDEGRAALAELGAFRINCFGHVGDGNLHYNVFPPPGDSRAAHADRAAEITRTIHDLVHAHGGSVSAEHGIGRFKVGDLERYGDPTKLAAMRAIKAALDPAGIFNPGAVLRL